MCIDRQSHDHTSRTAGTTGGKHGRFARRAAGRQSGFFSLAFALAVLVVGAAATAGLQKISAPAAAAPGSQAVSQSAAEPAAPAEPGAQAELFEIVGETKADIVVRKR